MWCGVVCVVWCGVMWCARIAPITLRERRVRLLLPTSVLYSSRVRASAPHPPHKHSYSHARPRTHGNRGDAGRAERNITGDPGSWLQGLAVATSHHQGIGRQQVLPSLSSFKQVTSNPAGSLCARFVSERPPPSSSSARREQGEDHPCRTPWTSAGNSEA